MRKAMRFIVQGTVQGVFFRRFVKENADKLSLKGFVRNLTTGDIEIVVEGEGEAIERFERFIAKGPEHAYIRHVQSTERKWTGEFDGFKILKF